jgi:hypothetical protein
MENASNPVCSAPGRWGVCGRPVHVKQHGLCKGHYTQHKRGSELAPLWGDYGPDTPCDFEGCDRSTRRNGYCNAHALQLKAGKPLRPLKNYRPYGTVLQRDELGRKNCPRCGEDKETTEFYPAKNTADGLGAICIRCDRGSKLLRKFKITLEDYDRLLEGQGGRCAICGTQECRTGKHFAVDHDHACCPGVETCGRCVRGLLCHNCNAILGLLGDDVDLAASAIRYLAARR